MYQMINGIRDVRYIGIIMDIRVNWTKSFTRVIGDIRVNRGIEIFEFLDIVAIIGFLGNSVFRDIGDIVLTNCQFRLPGC